MVMRRRPVGRKRPGERLATRRSRAGVTALAVLATGVGAAAGVVTPAGATIPGWGFEQVTPVVKGSGLVSTTVSGFIATPDGHRLLHSAYLPYESLPVESSPAQSRYVASRSAQGWVNEALDPPYLVPQSPVGTAQFVQAVLGVSQNLDFALIASRLPLTPGADPDGGSVYLKNTQTGDLRLIYTTTDQNVMAVLMGNGGANDYMYVANDGKSVLFDVYGDPLLPGAPGAGGGGGLYSWSEDAGLRYEVVVGGAMVNNLNIPGASNIGPRDSMPLDNDGLSHVYFQTGTNVNSGPIRVREGAAGQRATRLVTYSRLAAPPAPETGGVPLAVSAAGNHLLFRTGNNVALAGGEPSLTSTGRYLYRFNAEATAPADELTYIGAVPSAARIIQMSQDGKTIAFYSTLAQAGSPSGSQQKLFVWREGVGTRYVYSADAGSTGTSTQDQLRRLSDNGRYLVFTDNSASLAAQFGGFDNSSAGCPNVLGMPGPCDMVYRYDVVADKLDCVSCRSDGEVPLGASGVPGRTAAGLLELNRYQPRMASDDGTVFFTSRDGLLPEDRNALDDVYAWTTNDGLRLVSPATPGQRARFVDASSNGEVVFLASRERLAGTDVDEEDDIYATFAGAGFGNEATAPQIAPCDGTECRGAFSAPSGMAVSGSTVFAGPGNLPATGVSDGVKKIRVSKGKTVRGVSTKVKVKVPERGKIRTSGSGLAHQWKSATKAGSYRVTVKLSKRSRRALARKHRVKVRVTVRFTPSKGKTQRVRVSVTFQSKAGKKRSSPRAGRRAQVLSSSVGKGR